MSKEIDDALTDSITSVFDHYGLIFPEGVEQGKWNIILALGAIEAALECFMGGSRGWLELKQAEGKLRKILFLLNKKEKEHIYGK